jgi:hypothetical protein
MEFGQPSTRDDVRDATNYRSSGVLLPDKTPIRETLTKYNWTNSKN